MTMRRKNETAEQYRARRRDNYRNNPNERARINAENRRAYVKHRTKRIADARAYRKAHPESHTLHNRKAQGVAHLVGSEKRKGNCPICHKQDTPLVLDHCHNRNILRDWICAQCNLLLGVYEKNESNGKFAALRDYLLRFNNG